MTINWLDLPDFSERDGMLIRSGSVDTVPYAVFEGAVPTREEVRKILDWGYGLHLTSIPVEYRDLAFLDAFAGGLEYLGIADLGCPDISRVLNLRRLKELHVHVDQVRDVDLSVLTELERYSGPLRRFESVAACPRMRSLELQRVKDGWLEEIAGPVEELELVDLQKLKVLPRMRTPSALREMQLIGVHDLDISGIEVFTSLESVGFDGCHLLSSVDSLLRLPSLTGLSFAGCREIRPLDSLLELGEVSVSVLRKNPFNAEFRERAVRSRASWGYYGAPLPR